MSEGFSVHQTNKQLALQREYELRQYNRRYNAYLDQALIELTRRLSSLGFSPAELAFRSSFSNNETLAELSSLLSPLYPLREQVRGVLEIGLFRFSAGEWHFQKYAETDTFYVYFPTKREALAQLDRSSSVSRRSPTNILPFSRWWQILEQQSRAAMVSRSSSVSSSSSKIAGMFQDALVQGKAALASKIFADYVRKRYALLGKSVQLEEQLPLSLAVKNRLFFGFYAPHLRQTVFGKKLQYLWVPLIGYSSRERAYIYLRGDQKGDIVNWDSFFRAIDLKTTHLLQKKLAVFAAKSADHSGVGSPFSAKAYRAQKQAQFFDAPGIAYIKTADNSLDDYLSQVFQEHWFYGFLDYFHSDLTSFDVPEDTLPDRLSLYDLILVPQECELASLSMLQAETFLDFLWNQQGSIIEYLGDEGLTTDVRSGLYRAISPAFEEFINNIMTNPFFIDSNFNSTLDGGIEGWQILHDPSAVNYTLYNFDGLLAPSLKLLPKPGAHSTLQVAQNVTLPSTFQKTSFVLSLKASQAVSSEVQVALQFYNRSSMEKYPDGFFPLPVTSSWERVVLESASFQSFLNNHRGEELTLSITIDYALPAGESVELLFDNCFFNFEQKQRIVGLYCDTHWLSSEHFTAFSLEQIQQLADSLFFYLEGEANVMTITSNQQLTRWLEQCPSGVLVLTHPLFESQVSKVKDWLVPRTVSHDVYGSVKTGGSVIITNGVSLLHYNKATYLNTVFRSSDFGVTPAVSYSLPIEADKEYSATLLIQTVNADSFATYRQTAFLNHSATLFEEVLFDGDTTVHVSPIAHYPFNSTIKNVQRIAVASNTYLFWTVETNDTTSIHVAIQNGTNWQELAFPNDGLNSRSLAVAKDKQGALHLVWTSLSGGFWQVYYSMLNNSVFSARVPVSTSPSADAFSPLVAVSDATIEIFWQQDKGATPGWFYRSSLLPFSLSSSSSISWLANATSFRDPQLLANSLGYSLLFLGERSSQYFLSRIKGEFDSWAESSLRTIPAASATIHSFKSTSFRDQQSLVYIGLDTDGSYNLYFKLLDPMFGIIEHDTLSLELQSNTPFYLDNFQNEHLNFYYLSDDNTTILKRQYIPPAYVKPSLFGITLPSTVFTQQPLMSDSFDQLTSESWYQVVTRDNASFRSLPNIHQDPHRLGVLEMVQSRGSLVKTFEPCVPLLPNYFFNLDVQTKVPFKLSFILEDEEETPYFINFILGLNGSTRYSAENHTLTFYEPFAIIDNHSSFYYDSWSSWRVNLYDAITPYLPGTVFSLTALNLTILPYQLLEVTAEFVPLNNFTASLLLDNIWYAFSPYLGVYSNSYPSFAAHLPPLTETATYLWFDWDSTSNYNTTTYLNATDNFILKSNRWLGVFGLNQFSWYFTQQADWMNTIAKQTLQGINFLFEANDRLTQHLTLTTYSTDGSFRYYSLSPTFSPFTNSETKSLVFGQEVAINPYFLDLIKTKFETYIDWLGISTETNDGFPGEQLFYQYPYNYYTNWYYSTIPKYLDLENLPSDYYDTISTTHQNPFATLYADSFPKNGLTEQWQFFDTGVEDYTGLGTTSPSTGILIDRATRYTSYENYSFTYNYDMNPNGPLYSTQNYGAVSEYEHKLINDFKSDTLWGFDGHIWRLEMEGDEGQQFTKNAAISMSFTYDLSRVIESFTATRLGINLQLRVRGMYPTEQGIFFSLHTEDGVFCKSINLTLQELETFFGKGQLSKRVNLNDYLYGDIKQKSLPVSFSIDGINEVLQHAMYTNGKVVVELGIWSGFRGRSGIYEYPNIMMQLDHLECALIQPQESSSRALYLAERQLIPNGDFSAGTSYVYGQLFKDFYHDPLATTVTKSFGIVSDLSRNQFWYASANLGSIYGDITYGFSTLVSLDQLDFSRFSQVFLEFDYWLSSNFTTLEVHLSSYDGLDDYTLQFSNEITHWSHYRRDVYTMLKDISQFNYLTSQPNMCNITLLFHTSQTQNFEARIDNLALNPKTPLGVDRLPKQSPLGDWPGLKAQLSLPLEGESWDYYSLAHFYNLYLHLAMRFAQEGEEQFGEYVVEIPLWDVQQQIFIHVLYVFTKNPLELLGKYSDNEVVYDVNGDLYYFKAIPIESSYFENTFQFDLRETINYLIAHGIPLRLQDLYYLPPETTEPTTPILTIWALDGASYLRLDDLVLWGSAPFREYSSPSAGVTFPLEWAQDVIVVAFTYAFSPDQADYYFNLQTDASDAQLYFNEELFFNKKATAIKEPASVEIQTGYNLLTVFLNTYNENFSTPITTFAVNGYFGLSTSLSYYYNEDDIRAYPNIRYYRAYQTLNQRIAQDQRNAYFELFSFDIPEVRISINSGNYVFICSNPPANPSNSEFKFFFINLLQSLLKQKSLHSLAKENIREALCLNNVLRMFNEYWDEFEQDPNLAPYIMDGFKADNCQEGLNGQVDINQPNTWDWAKANQELLNLHINAQVDYYFDDLTSVLASAKTVSDFEGVCSELKYFLISSHVYDERLIDPSVTLPLPQSINGENFGLWKYSDGTNVVGDIPWAEFYGSRTNSYPDRIDIYPFRIFLDNDSTGHFIRFETRYRRCDFIQEPSGNYWRWLDTAEGQAPGIYDPFGFSFKIYGINDVFVEQLNFSLTESHKDYSDYFTPTDYRYTSGDSISWAEMWLIISDYLRFRSEVGSAPLQFSFGETMDASVDYALYNFFNNGLMQLMNSVIEWTDIYTQNKSFDALLKVLQLV
ncbi:MAG: hypothetical protein ACTSXO_09100, partial [Candidatus Heimdallarchaeota archaeon]